MSAVAASSSSSPAEAPESLEDQLRDCARFGELEDVEALLAAGARVDDAGPGGSTALHMAAANGHTAVIAALAARGALLLDNAAGSSALHWAALNGKADAVAALLAAYPDAARVLAKNALGRSPLTEALHRGHEEVARMLLTHKSADVEVEAGARAGAEGEGEGEGGGGGGGGGGIVEEETDDDVEEGGEGDADAPAAGGAGAPPATGNAAAMDLRPTR